MTYVAFDPPRRPEEYVGRPGPHNGAALEPYVQAAVDQSRALNRTHPYLVRGEWQYPWASYLDIAIDRGWLTANTNYRLFEGRLRWVCPECGKLSGTHAKGCGYER